MASVDNKNNAKKDQEKKCNCVFNSYGVSVLGYTAPWWVIIVVVLLILYVVHEQANGSLLQSSRIGSVSTTSSFEPRGVDSSLRSVPSLAIETPVEVRRLFRGL